MLYREVVAGKKISQIGLGTSQFGSEAWGYGAFYAEHEARLIVRRAVELGITLFDTAAIYGDGQSERILGEALGEDRASVFLATKAHPILPPSFRLPQRAAGDRAGVPGSQVWPRSRFSTGLRGTERNDSRRSSDSQQRDFGHPERERASNNRDELD